MMLGRYSQVVTSTGIINGTILAVGAKGISVAVDREVVRISPWEIHEISAAF
jgi:preprotein translocase subunit YajC